MTTLALLLLLSKPQARFTDAYLYPGGKAKYSLGKKFRRLRDGTRLDCALERRYYWILAHRGMDRRFERHRGKK